MMLLSQKYINENASREYHLKKSLGLEFLLNLLHMSTFFANVNEITKIIVPLFDSVNLEEDCDMDFLRIAHSQLATISKKFIKPIPKLTKFVALLE